MIVKKIRVALFSNNIEIYKKINSMENDFLTDKVSSESKINYDIIKKYDVLIFDSDLYLRDCQRILKAKTDNNVIIVVYEKTDNMGLQFETFSDEIEYFWELPLDFKTIESNLLRIKNKHDLAEENNLLRNYLDLITNGISDLVWFKDLDGKNFIVNDAFCEAAGKEKEDVLEKDDFYIWDIDPSMLENDGFDCSNTDKIVINTKKPYVSNEIMNLKDGSHSYRTHKKPIMDDQNNVVGTFGIAKDITNINNIKLELKLFIEALPFPVLFTDKNSKITSANNSFVSLFNTEFKQIEGKELLVFTEKRESFPEFELKTIEDKKLLFISDKIFKVSKSDIKDIFDNLTGYVYICSDYTIDYKYQNELLKIANTDQLTGLKNRYALLRFFENQKKDKDVIFLSFDLDNFKLVNDTLGHKAGDELLWNFSQILLKALKEYEVFRLGGDEFLAITFANENYETINNHINEVIKKFKDYVGKVLPNRNISVSIGIVKTDKDEKLKFEEIMSRSDSALYDAKRKGKDQFSYWNDQLRF